ncbi:MAG: hypothetical protein JSR99_13875 [Proteobacteria bacterium]|nr:hypothetical protein [Pseudomonadota bacterium]
MAEVDGTAHCDPLYLIGEIYGCAIAPRRWPAVLRKICNTVGGCAAALVTYSPRSDRLRLEARWNIGIGAQKIAATSFNPALSVIRLLGIETPVTTRTLFPNDERAQALWHERILAPEALDDVATIPLEKSSQSFTVLMIGRSAGKGKFRPAEAAMISVLSPHVRHADAITRTLAFTPLIRKVAPSCTDENPIGIILTDGGAKILQANAIAEEMLAGCALLCIEDELSARDITSDFQLRTAIRNAGRMRNLAQHADAAPLIVKGPGTRALAIRILPLGGLFELPGGSLPSVAVFVQPVEAADRPRAETFARPRAMTVARAPLAHLLEKLNASDVSDLLVVFANLRPRVSA